MTLLPLLRRGADGDDGLRIHASNMSTRTRFPSPTSAASSSSCLIISTPTVSPKDAAQDAGEDTVAQQAVHDSTSPADFFAGGVARLGDGVAGGGSVTQAVGGVLAAAEGLPVGAFGFT